MARRSERGRIGDADDGALYRSTDGAAHWTRVSLPAGTNGPNGLTVDPADPKRLYLSAWGVTHPDGDTGGGIFLSTDGAATWRLVLGEAQHVYDVTVDPRDPKVLYACGFDQAAFRSTDRGETWTRIRGFNFKWGQRVVADPRDPSLDLRHHLRRQRLARAGGRRPDVDRGRGVGEEDRPMTLGAAGILLLMAAAPPRASGTALPSRRAPSRLEQLVEANVLGTHAFQVALAKKDGKVRSGLLGARTRSRTRSSRRSRRTRPRS